MLNINVDNAIKILTDTGYTSDTQERNLFIIEACCERVEQIYPEQFKMYTIYVMDGIMQKEIAKQYNVSPTKVSKSVCNVRQWLRFYFDRYDVKQGYLPGEGISEIRREILDNFKVDIRTVGLHVSAISELSKRNVNTISELYKFIKDIGPTWSMFIQEKESYGERVEQKLNISWKDYYVDLDKNLDKIYDLIEYNTERRECNNDMLLLMINYYKMKYPMKFDLFYKYITDFDWVSIMDTYGRPKCRMNDKELDFLKYLKYPETRLFIFKGVTKNSTTANYKLYEIAKLADYPIKLVVPKYPNNTPLTSTSLSAKSINILRKLSCSTCGDARSTCRTLGPTWYYYLDRCGEFDIKEIETILDISYKE